MSKVKVKMKASLVGPDIRAHAGDEIELDEATAKSLEARGRCEILSAPKKSTKKKTSKKKTASRSQTETADG